VDKELRNIVRRLQPSSLGKDGQLPFLNEAYDEGLVIEGELIEIVEIKMTNSRNGYLLRTPKCVILLYKSSTWIPVLESSIEELLTENPSFFFGFIVDSDSPQGIELIIDEDVPRLWSKGKKFGAGIVYKSTTLDDPDVSTTRKARRMKSDRAGI
jgi:hypothetical protein